MENQITLESEITDDLEEKSLSLLNDFLNGKIKATAVSSNISVSNVAQERQDFDPSHADVDEPRLETSDVSSISYVESEEGNTLVIIPEGLAAEVVLDDKTAIATVGLESCYGYALHLLEQGKETFPLMHFTIKDNLGSLSDYLKRISPGHTVLESAYSVPYEGNSGAYMAKPIRELIKNNNSDTSEPVSPDTHNEMRHAGLLITKKEGAFLTQRIGGIYHIKSRWAWQKSPNPIK